MTPESRALAIEIVEAHLFEVRERRDECLRQAEHADALGADAPDLHGEGQRLAQRIRAIEALQAELQEDGEDWLG